MTKPFSRNDRSWNRMFSVSISNWCLLTLLRNFEIFLCPLRLRLHPRNAFELGRGREGKKINIKFYLGCEENVRKVNIVCRVRDWTFQFSIRNPKRRRKTFMENRSKIYMFLNFMQRKPPQILFWTEAANKVCIFIFTGEFTWWH